MGWLYLNKISLVFCPLLVFKDERISWINFTANSQWKFVCLHFPRVKNILWVQNISSYSVYWEQNNASWGLLLTVEYFYPKKIS